MVAGTSVLTFFFTKVVPGISVFLRISSQIFQSCACRVGCGYMGNVFAKYTVTHEQSLLRMCDLPVNGIPDLYCYTLIHFDLAA